MNSSAIDRDGLFQHLLPFPGRGPLRAGDVLVQRLAGTTPRLNLPPVSRPAVAAACAMTAGWIRVVGQVTAVVIGRLLTKVLECPSHYVK